MIRLSLLLILFLVTIPTNAFAVPDDGNRGDGTCDFTGYRDHIFITESKSAGGYEAANSISATGRYQFMPTTAADLSAYRSAPSQCKTMGVRSKGLATQSCAGVQDAMMDEFTLRNLKYLQNNCPKAVEAVAIGKPVTGYKVGGRKGSAKCIGKSSCTCAVTWSGLLAGAHLGGAGGICNSISSGDDVDDGATSRLFYVCEHAGLPVPGVECKPSEAIIEQGEDLEPWPEGNSPGARVSAFPGGNFNALSDTLKFSWVGAFQLMTSQLTATMMQQVQIIGSFFDAKHQLETQRLMQQKYAEAHKDYHPSVQMCEIGTFVRNLSNTEKRMELTQTAMSRSMLDRALISGDVETMKPGSDDNSRIEKYLNTFCDTQDNGKQNFGLCQTEFGSSQQNTDIDFTRTIDAPLTLDVNILNDELEPGEESLFAFLDYIFMNDRFPWLNGNRTVHSNFIEPYQEMRALIAMRSVAQNSFSHIIAEKSQGPDDAQESVAPFLKALMVEMGMTPQDIESNIGKNPSYYAQMEILSKKIYQHPEFISNLYDKPSNVKRVRAAMTAIKLMQDRDIHNALMRREMLMSMLLELKLREKQGDITLRNLQPVISSPTEEFEVYGDGANNDFGGDGVGTFNPETGQGGF